MGEFVRKDFAPKLKLTGVKIKGDETAWSDLTSDTLREIEIVLGILIFILFEKFEKKNIKI